MRELILLVNQENKKLMNKIRGNNVNEFVQPKSDNNGRGPTNISSMEEHIDYLQAKVFVLQRHKDFE